MKVLIIGSGAREHVLAKLVLKSTIGVKLYSIADYVNPGLKRESERTGGRLYVANTLSPDHIVKVAEEISPDLVVIGPEEPQFAGVTDALRESGFTVFGASKKLSIIEQSKVFARSFMWRHKIPGRLFFQAFRDLREAEEFMKYAGDVVVKPARQVGGKGVRVLRDTRAYLSSEKSKIKQAAVLDVLNEMKHYDDIEYKILVEQRVEGVEYTVHVITDGDGFVSLPVIQDHPHAFEWDIGPETGGMGCIAGPGKTPPFLTIEEYDRSVEIVSDIIRKLSEEMREQYTGVLAGQMMLTWFWGPTIIEFYSRFGDPEITAILPLVESDFLELLDRAANRRLAGYKLAINEEKVSIVKAVAPLGYPSHRKEATGHPIQVDEARIMDLGCDVVYGSVELGDNGIVTKGSRSVEIVCVDDGYPNAYEKAEKAVSYVRSLDGWPLFHRSDIGSHELLRERIGLAERVRRIYKYRASKGILGEYYVWIPSKGLFSNPLIVLLGGLNEST
ncbi:MAG: phosphoribosylamine--glycine ligase [Desulfurococcaceae archaeon]